MSEIGFNYIGLDDFSQKLLREASRNQPKAIKKFMRKEGSKLLRITRRNAKSRVKKKTGNYMESIKRGRPYKYGGQDDSIRVYSYAKHAHLIEDGHRVLTDGVETGFAPGKAVFHAAEREFAQEYVEDVYDLLDDLVQRIER